jgi:hypothetical protein
MIAASVARGERPGGRYSNRYECDIDASLAKAPFSVNISALNSAPSKVAIMMFRNLLYERFSIRKVQSSMHLFLTRYNVFNVPFFNF